MSETEKFSQLGLPGQLLKALDAVGYETPTPIQAQCIPRLLDGCDLLGQAQTGTGKTAAFALPLMARIDLANPHPQLLVMTPTRELAIQVAEAMQTYARFMPGFHVLPVYGGQGYGQQLRHLKRGVPVVVGTPGRIMDHMRRGSLKLDKLKALVLDEADEMLRMGFIDDVEWILEHTPQARQTALFSATMPKVIQRVAERFLQSPEKIQIEASTRTATSIHQRYWVASGLHKLDALTRVLEAEQFDAAIVFVRTRTATVELTEKLAARGFEAETLNGDIAQAQREKTVDRLRSGRTEVLVATDVAARGLDVPRISHVINYDIPTDTEAYVHRIGRTGRAGREGEAILFVAPRERRMLRVIEKAIGQGIEPMDMPTTRDINQSRLQRFRQRVLNALADNRDLSLYYQLLKEIEQETDVDALEIGAALASLLQGDTPLLLADEPERKPARERAERLDHRARPLKEFPEIAMQRYRVAVGRQHGVKPGNLVGAIAGEAEIDSCYIGHIELFDDFSLIDLPADMPKEILRDLKKARVCNLKLDIRPLKERDKSADDRKPKGRRSGKGKKRRDAAGGRRERTPSRKKDRK